MTNAEPGVGRTNDDQTRRPSPVRERILAVADSVFYAEGIRAVSADKIIAGAGISKVTFYRHFPTKDALVVAYLHGRSAYEQQAIGQARAALAGDPCAVLEAIASGIGNLICAPGFRGCPFINAAAEYAEADHPVRVAVAEHRAWFAQTVAAILTELEVADIDAVTEHLVMLRDGAMVNGYLGATGDAQSSALIKAGKAAIAAAKRNGK